MKGQVKNIGLEGGRGYPVVAEANVREEKEVCVIIGLPDAPMKESKERIALSLTGNLVPFHGLIPAIQQALLLGFKRIIVPPINLDFLGKNPTSEFIPIYSLEELLSYLRGQQLLTSMNIVLFNCNLVTYSFYYLLTK